MYPEKLLYRGYNKMFNEKSLTILELPVILGMLAEEAVCATAKQAALELRPSDNVFEVKQWLDETSSAKHKMTLGGTPPFSGVKDIRATVRRADMGGMLNTRELLDIAALLRAAASAIAYASGDKDTGKTAIDHLFVSLVSNKFLENKISNAIIGEEEIADSASGELSDIRRYMRLAGEKIRQVLNKIITSPVYSKALQEPIITMKNGRFVVPVKADQKSAVPGLVHDISSSGATQFIEPLSVVQINNEMRELAAQEKREIERILMELSADAAAHGQDLISDFEALSALDLIFAKAKLSYKLHATEPVLADRMRVKLEKARHPLLPGKEAVPVDIRLGGEFDTLVITGPNTGGKTVTMKTLGLLCLMAQCGLHIPVADGSIVPIFGSVFADIGDEQSIEQSLSTFSSHMANITGILEECRSDSLLLFDELGAGTDPVEGAALAMAIIEYARGKGALIAATTHYAELKTYAVTAPGVVNASCEFDVETLRPTYRLITGVPGKSNAFAISRRLGLPEVVIEDAKSRVNTENAAFEEALTGLEAARVALEGERLEAARQLREASETNRRAEELGSQIAREREKATDNAKREAAEILDEARKTAESVMEELRDMRRNAAGDADKQALNEQKAELFRRLNEAEDRIGAAAEEPEEHEPSREIVPGDKVRLRGLGTRADVVSISSDGVMTLQAGIMKITARGREVILIEGETQPEVKKQLEKSEAKLREILAKPELDLRGCLLTKRCPYWSVSWITRALPS